MSEIMLIAGALVILACVILIGVLYFLDWHARMVADMLDADL